MSRQYGYGNQQNPYEQRDNAPSQGYGGASPRGYGGASPRGYGGNSQRGYGGQQSAYGQRDDYGGQQGSRQGGYSQQRGGYDDQQSGYRSQQRGYGGQQNTYSSQQSTQSSHSSQRGYNRPRQQNPYDGTANRYGHENNSSMDGAYAGSTVEMAPLAQNAGSMANAQGNKSFLDRIQNIRNGIKQMKANLQSLEGLQRRVLNDASSAPDNRNKRELNHLSEETMKLYRTYVEEIRQLRSDPESHSARNTPQLDGVFRDLKDTIREFQMVENSYRKATEEQVARQYRIVNKDATPEQIQNVIRNGEQDQLFQKAIMTDRQGQAQSVLSAVKDRHAVLEQIERQMVELSQLFQDMDTLVVQQEAAVVQIEQKGEEVIDNLDKGNDEIGVAVNTARKTRKKKWICLGICVAIVVVIVIVVLIYMFVIRGTTGGGNNGGNNNNNNNNNANANTAKGDQAKRSIELVARYAQPLLAEAAALGEAVLR